MTNNEAAIQRQLISTCIAFPLTKSLWVPILRPTLFLLLPAVTAIACFCIYASFLYAVVVVIVVAYNNFLPVLFFCCCCGRWVLVHFCINYNNYYGTLAYSHAAFFTSSHLILTVALIKITEKSKSSRRRKYTRLDSSFHFHVLGVTQFPTHTWPTVFFIHSE